MSLLLNIGMQTNDGGSLTPGEIVDAIERTGPGPVLQYEIHESDTEPTLVAEVVNNGGARAAIHRLAELLRQDCIAAYVPRLAVGRLIGPGADKWGVFDPARFILVDGTRLSDAPAA